MLWLMGKIFKVALLLIIAAALVVVAVVMFVDPNDFKKEISDYLKSYTGQEFTIKGDVSWSYKPDFALFLNDVDLNGNSNIKNVSIYLDPYSILSGTLVIENLQLNNANITVDITSDKNSTSTPTDHSSPQKLIIQNADLHNSTVVFIDTNNGINFELRSAEIQTQDLTLNGAYTLAPVSISGNLIDLNNNLAFNIETTATVQTDKQIIDLDPLSITWTDTTFQGSGSISKYDTNPVLSASIKVEDSEISELLERLDPYFSNTGTDKHTMSLAADFTYSTEEHMLDITNLDVKLDDGTLNGTLKLGFMSPRQANFELAADGMDFRPIFKLAVASFPNSLPTGSSIPVELLQNLTLSGKFAGKNLVIKEGFLIDQLTVEAIVKDSKLQLAPIMLSAYDSTHSMSLYIDVTGDIPFVEFSEQADNVKLEPWFDLFEVNNKVSGTAKIKAQLKGLGSSQQSFMQSLSGNLNVYIEDGHYYGLDVDKIMDFEIKLVNDTFKQLVLGQITDLNSSISAESSGWIKTQDKKPSTDFNTADFKATFEEGISTETSFSITDDDYAVKGTGTIDLANDTLNLEAQVSSIQKVESVLPDLAKYMQDTPFIITVTGTPMNRTYGPDVRGYATTAIQLILDDAMKTAVLKMVTATPPNAKTNQNAEELFVDSLQGLLQ